MAFISTVLRRLLLTVLTVLSGSKNKLARLAVFTFVLSRSTNETKFIALTEIRLECSVHFTLITALWLPHPLEKMVLLLQRLSSVPSDFIFVSDLQRIQYIMDRWSLFHISCFCGFFYCSIYTLNDFDFFPIAHAREGISALFRLYLDSEHKLSFNSLKCLSLSDSCTPHIFAPAC